MSWHIIYGPMFSGKTTRLIEIASKLSDKLMIGHTLDNRCPNGQVSTHDGLSYPAEKYSNLMDISKDKIEKVKYILIDEAQFFTDLMEFCQYCRIKSKIVYVSGLIKDYKKDKFGQISNLLDIMDIDDTKTELLAECSCGEKAINTRRKTMNNEIVVVGGSDLYESVCDICYDKKNNTI